MPKSRMVVGALRELREEKGMTQAELAQASGLSQGMISLYERASADPSSSSLIAISRALDMTVQQFLDRCFDEPEVA